MGKSLIIKGADFSEVAVDTIQLGSCFIDITLLGVVTITAQKATAIYYTTDGSTPTTSSSLYTEPFNLNHTTIGEKTVKAMAVFDGEEPKYVSKKYKLEANTFSWGKGGISVYGQTTDTTNMTITMTGDHFVSDTTAFIINTSVAIGTGNYAIRLYYIGNISSVGTEIPSGELVSGVELTNLTVPAGKHFQIGIYTGQQGVNANVSQGTTALLVASVI